MVRFRVDFHGPCSVGIGKIQLLEGIRRSGSLSEAARQMKMSYRRAWLLLTDLNSSFNEPVATASVGGRNGGGVALTPFGERLIAGYRRFESELQPLADACLGEFGRQVKLGRAKEKRVATGSIRGRSPNEPAAPGAPGAPAKLDAPDTSGTPFK